MMKPPLSLVALAFAIFVGTQTQAPVAKVQTTATLPQTFPELVAVLPALVHSNRLDFASYSDAVSTALRQKPDSASAAIPMLFRNLQDPDQDVESYTLAILQELALRTDYARLVLPLSNQLATAISVGNEHTKILALAAVENLRREAPKSVVQPVESLLASKSASVRLTIGAAETLMAIRPTDNTAQDEVLAVINDPNLPPRLRLGIIQATSRFGVGSKIRDNVVHLANTSSDKSWRDTAIAGAEQIGPDALAQIRDVLRKIVNDPTESSFSQQTAHQALSALAMATK